MYAFPLRMVCLAAMMAMLHGCTFSGGRRSISQGIPNFLRVDKFLFRGGQPSREGIRELAKMGVKTIVNLRVEDAELREEEQALAESLGMRWVHIPMHILWRPSDEQLSEFFDIVNNPELQPVFVHCRQGEDRTGTVVAYYRVNEYGWKPQEAYEEARMLGLDGWNLLLRDVILNETIRQNASTTPSLHTIFPTSPSPIQPVKY